MSPGLDDEARRQRLAAQNERWQRQINDLVARQVAREEELSAPLPDGYRARPIDGGTWLTFGPRPSGPAPFVPSDGRPWLMVDRSVTDMNVVEKARDVLAGRSAAEVTDLHVEFLGRRRPISVARAGEISDRLLGGVPGQPAMVWREGTFAGVPPVTDHLIPIGANNQVTWPELADHHLGPPTGRMPEVSRPPSRLTDDWIVEQTPAGLSVRSGDTAGWPLPDAVHGLQAGGPRILLGMPGGDRVPDSVLASVLDTAPKPVRARARLYDLTVLPPAVPESARAEVERQIESAAGEHSVESVDSAFILRGTNPAPLTDAARKTAGLAPHVLGEVRILPETDALPNLKGFLDALPPWLHRGVAVDMRLIPPDVELPFNPRDLALDKVVAVDVRPDQVTDGDPVYGYLVGSDNQRTIRQFASAYRYTSGYVPDAPTSFVPLPPLKVPQSWPPSPAPQTPGEARPAPAGQEPTSFELPEGFVATVTTDATVAPDATVPPGAIWVHRAADTTPPPAVADHRPQPDRTTIFVDGGGAPTPEAVWHNLLTVIGRVTPDVAERLDFVAVNDTPAISHAHIPATLPPAAKARAKVTKLASSVFPAPTTKKIQEALQDFAGFVWGARTDGMPQPTIRVAPPSAAHRTGEFQYKTWSVVVVQPTEAELAKWGEDDWHALGTLAAHELVHADQFAKIARLLAGQHPTKEELEQALPSTEKVIDAALRRKIRPGHPEYDEAKALHDSIMGPGREQMLALDANLAHIHEQFDKVDLEMNIPRPAGPTAARDAAAFRLARQKLSEDHAFAKHAYQHLGHELPAYGYEDAVAGGRATSPVSLPTMDIQVEPVSRPVEALGRVAPTPAPAPPMLDPRLRDAIAELTRNGLGDKAAKYLAATNPADRKRIMANLSRAVTDPDGFRAVAALPGGVDVAATAPVPSSEAAQAKMLAAIGMALDGDVDGAVELAVEARPHLSGSARFETVKLLKALGAAPVDPQVVAPASDLSADLRTLQLAIVKC